MFVFVFCFKNLKKTGSFKEAEDNIITFPDIEGLVLEKVIEYLYYKQKYSKSKGQIPEYPIDPSVALELLVASNYLNC